MIGFNNCCVFVITPTDKFTRGQEVWIYDYKKDSVIQNTIYYGKGIFTTSDWTEILRSGLNSQSYISGQIYSISPGYYTAYQYDNSGYRIKEISNSYSPNPVSSSINNYSYTNGNLSSIEGGGFLRKYEYYTDKENTLSNESYGNKFTGRDSKNLLKKETDLTLGMAMYTYTISYEYEFDKDNYPVKKTSIVGSSRSSETYTYKW